MARLYLATLMVRKSNKILECFGSLSAWIEKVYLKFRINDRTHAEPTYKMMKKCPDCGHMVTLIITEREAVFELINKATLGWTCKKCWSRSVSIWFTKPKQINFSLLKEWATNPSLYLMEQDQHLILAEEQYLENILELIDTVPMPVIKRDTLMEALCVIVYDNTDDENTAQEEELKKKVIEELNKRLDKLKLADDWIAPYLKDNVYPQLTFDDLESI